MGKDKKSSTSTAEENGGQSAGVDVFVRIHPGTYMRDSEQPEEDHVHAFESLRKEKGWSQCLRLNYNNTRQKLPRTSYCVNAIYGPLRPAVDDSGEILYNNVNETCRRPVNSETSTTTRDIFKGSVEPQLKKAAAGEPYVLMAYGESGAGKTFTLIGKNGDDGLLYMIIEWLIKQQEATHVEMRCVEVYEYRGSRKAQLFDLFARTERPEVKRKKATATERQELLDWEANQSGKVADVTKLKHRVIKTSKELKTAITYAQKRARFAKRGSEHDCSSRGPTVHILKCSTKDDIPVSIIVCDLAGSEGADHLEGAKKKSDIEKKELKRRQGEQGFINQGLVDLKYVVQSIGKEVPVERIKSFANAKGGICSLVFSFLEHRTANFSVLCAIKGASRRSERTLEFAADCCKMKLTPKKGEIYKVAQSREVLQKELTKTRQENAHLKLEKKRLEKKNAELEKEKLTRSATNKDLLAAALKESNNCFVELKEGLQALNTVVRPESVHCAPHESVPCGHVEHVQSEPYELDARDEFFTKISEVAQDARDEFFTKISDVAQAVTPTNHRVDKDPEVVVATQDGGSLGRASVAKDEHSFEPSPHTIRDYKEPLTIIEKAFHWDEEKQIGIAPRKTFITTWIRAALTEKPGEIVFDEIDVENNGYITHLEFCTWHVRWALEKWSSEYERTRLEFNEGVFVYYMKRYFLLPENRAADIYQQLLTHRVNFGNPTDFSNFNEFKTFVRTRYRFFALFLHENCKLCEVASGEAIVEVADGTLAVSSGDEETDNGCLGMLKVFNPWGED